MAIKLYWCRGKGRDDIARRNFGDYLSPLLVEMLSGKPVIYAPVHKADMMAIGSIMPRLAKARRFLLPRRLHVWGAGTDAPGLSFSSRHFYHAVRGVRTLEQIAGLKSAPALGDPGLLVSQWWGGRVKPEKRYRLGLIPHYVDRENPLIREVAQKKGVCLIDVFDPIEEVLRQVQSCDYVMSSSMHGLIVADAFGIPNRRLILSQGLISDFKFSDYYSAFGLDEPPALQASVLSGPGPVDPETLIGEYQRPGLAEIQMQLVKAFPAL